MERNTGSGVRLSEVVVLQVAVAVLVDQIAAFRARRFGDQDAGERQPGRVVLHELHVLERRAGAVGERHAIAALDGGVRGEGKHATQAARAQDDGTRGDRLDLAGLEIDRNDAMDSAIIDEKPSHEPFVVANHAGVFQGGLEQGVEHVEAGLVGGEPRAHLLHAPEGANGNPAVALPAPRTPPVLQAQQLLRRLLDERLDGVLIAQPVAARDRVVGVLVEAVVGSDRAGGAALRGHRVAPHGIDLRHHSDLQTGIGLGNRDRGAQARAPTTHHHHIMGRRHVLDP